MPKRWNAVRPLRRPLNGALMDFKWPTRLNPPFAQSFISDYIRRNRAIAGPPPTQSTMTPRKPRGLRLPGSEKIYERHTSYAESDGRLARRKHLADVRANCGLLRPSCTRSQRHRRWRRGAWHSRFRPDHVRAAAALGDCPCSECSVLTAEAFTVQGLHPRNQIEARPEIYSRVAAA